MGLHAGRGLKFEMQGNSIARFGAFELNLRTGELRKSGVRVRLQDQPFQVLAALLEHPGELVTREQLQSRLWPDSLSGDFEQGLNKAVNKLRTALSDSADNPRFVETLARRGYRFLAPVEFRDGGTSTYPAKPLKRKEHPEEHPTPPTAGLDVAAGPGAPLVPETVPVPAEPSPPLPLWESPADSGKAPRRSWSVMRFALVTLSILGMTATAIAVAFVVWVAWPDGDSQRPLPPGAAGSDGEVVAWSPTEQRFAPIEPAMSADGVAYSRDGEWLAFVSYPSAKLWVMRKNGSDLTEIGPGEFERTYVPAWSPDGERLAFAGQRPDRPWKVYVVNHDGTGLREVNPGPGTEADPTWSPDGKTLAMAPFPWDTSATGIYLADLETNSFRVLEGSRGWFSPRWSPDGRYMGALTADQSRLGLFDFETRTWRDISGTGAMHPIWNESSTKIYYLIGEGENRIERYIMSNGRNEPVISIEGMALLSNSPFGPRAAPWVGLTPDDRPMVLRSRSADQSAR